MKILIFSDSHGKTESMLAVAHMLAKDVSHMLHLGDNVAGYELLQRSFPSHAVHGVAGNCDFFSNAAVETLLEINGKRILMTHGHRHGVKADIYRLHCAAREQRADICLYGHTHIANVETADGILLMNPGSIALPRGYEHKSYGIIDIADSGQINAAVVALHRGTYKIIRSN